MDIEISDYFKNLNKKTTVSQYVDDRDRVVEELNNEKDDVSRKLKVIFSKPFKVDSGIIHQTHESNQDVKGELIFIPKSLVMFTSQGKIHKGIKCDVIIKNLVHRDIPLEDMIKMNNSDVLKIFFQPNKYYIRDVFNSIKKYVSLNDYDILINDIRIEYDE